MQHRQGTGTIRKSLTIKRALHIAACVTAWSALSGAAPVDMPQNLSVSVEGLRSAKGMLMICLTRLPDHFPNCANDPDRRHYYVPVAQAKAIAVNDLPPGNYALALIHDENSNRKLDTFAGIPREGVGFSENPPIHFGAPSFRAARFTISGSAAQQDVRVKYFL